MLECLICFQRLQTDFVEITDTSPVVNQLNPLFRMTLYLHELSDSEDEEIVWVDKTINFDKGLAIEHRTDPSLASHTKQDIAMVAKLLQDSGILSMVVGNDALRYYGARIIRSFSTFAVPQSAHESAVNLLSSHPGFEFIGLSKQWSYRGPSLHYPKFHHRGTTLYILVVPDRAWGLRCIPSNIQIDPVTLIPYPTLSHFAQSFLRTKLITSLEMLVDGQDLDTEWGEAHLNFGQHSRKRALWERTVSEKIKRIPREKPAHLYATRFKLRGLSYGDRRSYSTALCY